VFWIVNSSDEVGTNLSDEVGLSSAFFPIAKTDSLSEENKKSLLQFSSVSIALSSLRGFITSLTANAPFGKYTLPSIDVNDLFNQKSKTRLKQSSKKSRK
jgi:preprotein translocase subunit SecB